MNDVQPVNGAAEKHINVFIGPKKTGTSWLFNLAAGTTKLKEIRYPSKWFRQFVYSKYVDDRELLVWPYLIHEPGCLNALIADFEKNDQPFTLYYTDRNREDLLNSMQRFFVKYGMKEEKAKNKSQIDLDKVATNLEQLERKYTVNKISIIEAAEKDITEIAKVCNITSAQVREALKNKVYVGNESSRINSLLLTELFFKIKAFLPTTVQEVTKSKVLRKIFFRKKIN